MIFTKSLFEAQGRMVYCGILCSHCRISFPGMRKTVEKVARLEKNQEDIISSLDKLENGGVKTAIKDVLEEKQNVEARKLNLICFGLKKTRKTVQKKGLVMMRAR